jgi:hypothetical protein
MLAGMSCQDLVVTVVLMSPNRKSYFFANKFELVINFKTAKALGLTTPRRCSHVDEEIE